ncbi:MAG: tripartite tricarboxylate transporter substrate binding protein [Proteobacteria bacterium]|nr:tripartite tricarboxylate transporter substrate binding protein [Burkholderiales bacterium]
MYRARRQTARSGVIDRSAVAAALVALGCVALSGTHGSAEAQEYPARTVRLIAPFAPGGATDALARIVAQRMTERYGQPVVVEYRAGAGGNLGAELVVKSAPDGYTLLLGGVPHAIGMSLYRTPGYDLAKDLSAVANLAGFPSLIAVHPSLPVKSVKELVGLARANPAALTYGSAGNGSPNHMAMELFNSMAKTRMVHVPYKGTGQMIGDLVGGHVQLASVGFPAALPLVKAGRLRVLAVTGSARSPLLPEVPTVAEQGLAGFNVNSWYGVFAPAALPRELAQRLSTDITALMSIAEVRERLAALGAEPMPMAPEEFSRFVRDEIVLWARIVRESGARVE